MQARVLICVLFTEGKKKLCISESDLSFSLLVMESQFK